MVTIEADSYLIPDEPIYQFNWIAVSANFEGGTEGKRSIAISTTPKPTALATNNMNDEPCIFEPMIFETQSTDTLLDYIWKFGSDSEPNEATTRGPHSVVFNKTGVKFGGLTITNDGGTDQITFFINVRDELEAKETELIKEGGGDDTFKSKITGATTYTWDFGDGHTGTGKTVSHTYTESGTFTVTLLAENACGMVTETDQVSINLTNVNDLTEKDFAISPNPNQGDFDITLPDLEGNSVNIQLIASDGRLIDSKRFDITLPGQKVTWNDVSSGLYFLKFTVGQKEISRRLIVE